MGVLFANTVFPSCNYMTASQISGKKKITKIINKPIQIELRNNVAPRLPACGRSCAPKVAAECKESWLNRGSAPLPRHSSISLISWSSKCGVYLHPDAPAPPPPPPPHPLLPPGTAETGRTHPIWDTSPTYPVCGGGRWSVDILVCFFFCFFAVVSRLLSDEESVIMGRCTGIRSEMRRQEWHTVATLSVRCRCHRVALCRRYAVNRGDGCSQLHSWRYTFIVWMCAAHAKRCILFLHIIQFE